MHDTALFTAVDEIRKGLYEADLGGGIIKKRVALAGRGKSGSARTLLATNRNERWIFLFGFEKNERSNISASELEALKLLSHDLLSLSAGQFQDAVRKGSLLEVNYET